MVVAGPRVDDIPFRSLRIVVIDDGPGPRQQPWQEGVGLKNTRQRLEHLYGDQFSFQCKTRDPGFVVEMILPFESEPDQ